MKFNLLFFFGVLIHLPVYAQSVPQVTVKDRVLFKLFEDYIAESKLKQILTDSTGIVFVSYGRTTNGYRVQLSAIKEQRSSYFIKSSIPAQYTFIDGVLVLFASSYMYNSQLSAAYLQAVDTLVEGRFKRLEEEKGFLVKWEYINGKYLKNGYSMYWGDSNEKLITYPFDGSERIIQKMLN
jgi:hypothetical protein